MVYLTQIKASHLSPGRPAWLLLGLVAAVDVVWIAFSAFSIGLKDVLLVLACGGAALVAGFFYAWVRPAPPLAACCSAAAFLIFFTAAGAILSYLCASVVLPFQDDAFIAFDEALGLDWAAHVAWVVERPAIMHLLNIAYLSLFLQVPLLLVWLAFRDRKKLSEFMVLYAFTAIAVVLTALVVPAIGAHVVTPLSEDMLALLPNPMAGRYHVEPLLALRDGGLRHIPLRNMEGLVTFPSFHTVLAILLAYGFARVSILMLPMLALNALVIVSTISIGGHYLADVVSGAALALAAIAAFNMRERSSSRSVENKRPADGGIEACR